MRRLAVSVAVGLMVGLVSRAVDTAAWAPSWIGFVVTPWLALAFAAGAWTSRGAMAGVAALAAVTAAYLAAAGPDAARLWPLLALLSLAGGALFGWAGAAWGRGEHIGLLCIGLALALEGVGLQLGERMPVARAAFAAEAVIGLAVVIASIRRVSFLMRPMR